jgi:hypothetical protein
LNILKEDQSSLLLNTKIPLTPSLFGGHLVYNPLFLFAGALFFDTKISTKLLCKPSFEPFWRPQLSSEHKKEKMFGFEDCFVE